MQKQLQIASKVGLYKTQVRMLFHAHIKMKLPAACSEALFDDLYTILTEIDERYNSHREHSFIDLINKSAGTFVEVDEDTLFMLEMAKKVSGYFEGTYDITLMPLIRLWGFYDAYQKNVPTRQAIENTLSLIDYRKIEIEGAKVRIQKGQEVTTGSFMKAYAVDKVIEKIKAEGITDALINAGGSTIAVINNSRHPHWRVNVPDPDNDGQNLFQVKLANACFSTSAQAKNFITINGIKYGHILNGRTGYPSANKQTGVITESCFLGDIVSTALFTLDNEQFAEKLNLLAQQFPVAGFLIDANSNTTYCGGFEKNILPL